MPPRATALILVCALSALAFDARALGFGKLSGSAVLGQPLDLPVLLHLEPGERIEPDCVQAEVAAGESRWGRDQVRVRLEPGSSGSEWIARIRSTPAVDEPVVEITLTLGCERRFSRRFVAFADPPGLAAVRREPSPVIAAAPPAVSTATAPPPLRAEPAARTAPVASRPTRQRASAPAASPRTSARKAAPVERKPPTVVARAGTGARLLLDVGGPRLKLDMEDPVFMPPGSADGAASGPDADTGTVPETQRLQLLEKTLSDLQRETQSARQATGALRVRLAEAERGSRALPWVVALLALAIAVVVWLTWRLRRQQQQVLEAPQWWSPDQAGDQPLPGAGDDDVPVPADHALLVAPRRPFVDELKAPTHDLFGDDAGEATSPLPAALALERELAPRTPAPATPAPLPEPLHERTMAIGGSAESFAVERSTAEPPAAREVSVEELLDLEQQADFFLALGQEDAAIDLLMSHLRSTGGLSPLPYTKLLEIYRRQQDREAYERIRARFNRRFNAYAPDWEAGPLSGRALEDYAEVVQQLQALWPEPLNAMALLEAMLFRKDAAHELFDLPAYKDVLLLYSLARDLWQQQGGLRAGGVDVLLPLEEDPSAHAVAQAEPAGAIDELPQFQLTAYAPPPRLVRDDEDEADGSRR